MATRRNHNSQECKDPRRQCFCDSWPWPFDPKMNGYPGFIVEHFVCQIWRSYLHRGFEVSCGKRTNKCRWKSYPANSVCVGNVFSIVQPSTSHAVIITESIAAQPPRPMKQRETTVSGLHGSEEVRRQSRASWRDHRQKRCNDKKRTDTLHERHSAINGWPFILTTGVYLHGQRPAGKSEHYTGLRSPKAFETVPHGRPRATPPCQRAIGPCRSRPAWPLRSPALVAGADFLKVGHFAPIFPILTH